jgi:hypothetical protein
MCGDGCRCFFTDVLRGFDNTSVAKFVGYELQSLTRGAQGFFQSEQFRVGLRHYSTPPLGPFI